MCKEEERKEDEVPKLRPWSQGIQNGIYCMLYDFEN